MILDVPNGKHVTRELARREDAGGFPARAGIRIAPHFYTTDEELEQTVSAVQECLAVAK